MKRTKSYAEREYGVTPRQLRKHSSRVRREIGDARRKGLLIPFTGDIEAIVGNSITLTSGYVLLSRRNKP